MKVLLSILLLFFSISAVAQTEPAMLWMKGIGGVGSDQLGPNVVETDDGGFVIRMESASFAGTGSIDSFCSPVQKRMIYVKYNDAGAIVEWSKCYGTMGDSFLMFMFPLSGGGEVLGGKFNSSAGWGWLITKHNAAGAVIWQRNYSKSMGSQLDAMIATDDGGYIMLGEANRTDTNVLVHYGSWDTHDFWIMKVDSNGYKVWSRVVGGTGDESAGALVPGPNNGFYVVGGTGSTDYDCTGNRGAADTYVARFNDTGGIMWHRCFGGSLNDEASAACSNGKGGLIVASYASSSDYDVHNHILGADYWVMEVDSAGSILWDNCYGGLFDRIPKAICRATDGSIWINGIRRDFNDHVYLVHTDSVGNELHSATLTSSQQDWGQMIHPLPGGFVLAGGYYGSNDGPFSSLASYGSSDVYLSMYAPWPAATKEVFNAKSFRIFPNPVDKLLHIEIKEAGTVHSISIVDVAGRKVMGLDVAPGKQTMDISTEKLSKGIYFVQVVDDDGGRFVEKIEIR
jgi:hypothetical protein